MMRKTIWVASILLAGAVVVGPELVRSQQATQPAAAPAPAVVPASGSTMAVLKASDPAKLELRANQAFNRSEYAIALPMYQVLVEKYKDNPEKLGPTEEKVRVCQKNLAPALAAANAAAATVKPSVLPTSEEQRTPHPVPTPGKVPELPIKELGNFDYDRNGGVIPADVKRLSGVTVRTRGFMVPLDQADNITEFALVPSLFSCCYGQPPQIQHTIVVHCPKGKAVSYFPDELVVEGKLLVEEKKDDGFAVSLFELEASSVRPAPQ